MSETQEVTTSIYIVGPSNGPKKIGLANKPESRLRVIQTGHPKPISLLFSKELPCATACDIEGYVHWLLREKRSHGEWFNVGVQDAKDAIEAATIAVVNGGRARRSVGRKKQWAEDMQARFAQGTFERIAAVLVGKEDRTDFVRDAVEKELRRRERGKEKGAPDKERP